MKKYLEVSNPASYFCSSSLSITYQERQRDFGPMTPWQPIHLTQLYEGANSDPVTWREKISQSKSLINSDTVAILYSSSSDLPDELFFIHSPKRGLSVKKLIR